MRQRSGGSVRTRALIALALPFVLLVVAGPVAAQDPSASPTAVPLPSTLSVTTTYPSITVDPGAEGTFPLSVTAPTAQRVDLSVTAIPEGWTAQFRGGGLIVNSVTTTLDVPPELELAVDVPEDAPPGDFSVTLTATAESGTVDLPLDVKVSDLSGGELTLTSTNPALTGDTSAPFSFSVRLRNETSQQLTVGFEVAGPDGWDVTAKPSGAAQAATAVVEPGANTTITVSADPPPFAAAGDYPIQLLATAGDFGAAQDLLVRLTGSLDLTLTGADNRLNTTVSAGAESTYTVVLQNTGTAPLVGVAVSATAPTSWQVKFDQETVDIPVESQVSVVAAITPSGNAVAGDYIITVRASAGQVNESLQVRATVETSTLWLYVGIGLIALVLVGLFLVFRRYGRR